MFGRTSSSIRSGFGRALVSGGAIACALSLAATATANALTLQEEAYLLALHSEGIVSSAGDVGLLAAGHRVCALRHQGLSNPQLVAAVLRANHLSEYDAGFVVGAATPQFCAGR